MLVIHLPSYLRDFSKLCVGLAALLCRLHSHFVVVHKCSVDSKLAGLMDRERKTDEGSLMNLSVMVICDCSA